MPIHNYNSLSLYLFYGCGLESHFISIVVLATWCLKIEWKFAYKCTKAWQSRMQIITANIEWVMQELISQLVSSLSRARCNNRAQKKYENEQNSWPIRWNKRHTKMKHAFWRARALKTAENNNAIVMACIFSLNTSNAHFMLGNLC
jgi:hypothetical protein